MPLALCHRFDLPLAGVRPLPSLAEYSHSAYALSGRRRSSRSCFKPIRFKHSDKACQCHRFRVTTHQAFRGLILPHGSIQFRANPGWIPFRERRIVLRACSPTPFYDLERPIRCTYSPATSNGNGGKTPALPGNCCRQRKVRIRIRGLTPARC